ncbi:YdcP family protein [Bacillus paralicheniformis]|uniref:YdcP family protein n=1 Tax=Bacillus TaxID=1386 RepID=UPI000C757D87|nr:MULTISPECIES: YdcP family protein [Bacillus]MCY7912557.1 YdcP family protein [Bacillus haynesii]MCY7925759.1 YdcP family protein [Bacillus haynesii]MCY8588490.1 YdcP family protein [Bacillus haynesii]MCY8774218.1 YdcP family protein [Bacillus haynesii]MEC0789535.1 YdcP family protein [Bacillus haynesii]
MNLNFIVPEINMTFGELKFLGLNRERYAYVDGKRTDTLESRVYNLGSSVQGGQIEVTIPAYVDLKEFDFFKDVELKNPKISASARANGTFANVNWTVEAEDLVLKGAGSSPANKTVTPGTSDKK